MRRIKQENTKIRYKDLTRKTDKKRNCVLMNAKRISDDQGKITSKFY